MRSFFVLLLLGIILATIAIVVRSGMLARKNPGRPINAAMRLAMDTPQFSHEDAAIIAEKYGNAHRTPSGLEYVVRAVGTGPNPKPGAYVTVSYEGRFLNDVVFDRSQPGKPFQFTVGTSQVIKGWDEAILSMRKGERRTLIVPYWLGYGEMGNGAIPPRSTLVFDVELIDFQ